MLSRRSAVLAGALLTSGCTGLAGPRPRVRSTDDFVRVEGQRFVLQGRAYRFVGANIWYGAYLGANGPTGDKTRLRRELDALAALGVTNLRVLGASELSPLKNSLNPAFHGAAPPYNEDLLAGLDVLLAEMGRRGMKAVVYLNNFWEWSGGFATYLYWTNGGHYIDADDPAHPWPAFADFSARFYSKPEAVALYRDYVGALIARVNTVTGTAYRDDPTIMAWQLANEPRPGGSETLGLVDLPSFYAWIAETAKFIKARDPNHLVSTGSEGLRGCLDFEDIAMEAHAIPQIDYLTFHTWPQNWEWIDPQDLPGTYSQGETLSRNYVAAHRTMAERLNKPAVAEEFGFPRDAGFEPGTPTTFKDRFYTMMYDQVLASAQTGGPLAGSNFWAWGGQGRAQHDDRRMRRGDTSYVGDPPHEPQGWYSVFDKDASTLALIRRHAAALAAVG